MRKRNKSIIIRLTEDELKHIDEMVDNSYLDRENFLRKLLSGYIMAEVPKDYRQFSIDLMQIASRLKGFNFNDSFTPAEKDELWSLSDRLWELYGMLMDIYTPYYQEWQRKHGRRAK